jgi:uroporphyrinogen decarboxylase
LAKFEKIEAAIRGEPLEEIPMSLWHHFPRDDLKAERLVDRAMAFQERFDSDFMKFSPSGAYPHLAFGAEIEYYPSMEEEIKALGVYNGVPKVTKLRINSLDDWETLEEVDINEGILGEMLRAAKLIAEKLNGRVPFIETMFSPMTTCQRLAGDRWRKDLDDAPEKVSQALDVISRTMTKFARAAVDYGASGVFLSVSPTYDWFTEGEYRRFGMRYDLRILRATKPKAWFNVAHAHGSNLMFDLVAENYPVEGINWADKRTPPSLEEAFEKFNGALIGGLNETETLLKGSPKEVEEEVLRSIEATGGRRLILAPGCVIPLNAPEANLDVAIRAAKSHRR